MAVAYLENLSGMGTKLKWERNTPRASIHQLLGQQYNKPQFWGLLYCCKPRTPTQVKKFLIADPFLRISFFSLSRVAVGGSMSRYPHLKYATEVWNSK